MTRLRRAASVVPLIGLTIVLSSCSVTLAQSDLEKEVGSGIDGVTEVSCDGDLKGEVGATQDCTITFDGDTTQDVVATVTKVDGKTVTFDRAPADGEVPAE